MPGDLRELELLLRARYAYLGLISSEESRWVREVTALSRRLKRTLRHYSDTLGLSPDPGGDGERTPGSAGDPRELLEELASHTEPRIYLLRDFHRHFGDPWVVRRLRDLEEALTRRGSAVLFLSPRLDVPVELASDMTLLELELPGPEDLRPYVSRAFEQLVAKGAQEPGDPALAERVERALMGLTERDALRVLRRACLDRSALDDSLIRQIGTHKRAVLGRSELLDFLHTDEALEGIGGMGELKGWVRRRRRTFLDEARARGLPTPKGLLLIGVQGCGKSLAAKAIAREWGFPLLRLDLSAVVRAERGVIGQTLREALSVTERLAPVVLWVDELEKGFADAGSADAPATRALGSFITWMQEKQAPVFVAATANRVDQLPPELLRKGRFDEVFFVDLPSLEERAEVLRIHLRKRDLRPEDFDVEGLAAAGRMFSGAELEQAVLSACYEAYDEERAPETADIREAMKVTVPLAVTMREQLEELRGWARTRARAVSLDTRLRDMITQTLTDDGEPNLIED